MRESTSPGEIYPDPAWLCEARGTTEVRREGTGHPAENRSNLGRLLSEKVNGCLVPEVLQRKSHVNYLI